MRRTRDGLVLEDRVEYGGAARRNRGSYSGTKTHRLWCWYVVDLEPGYEPPAGTFGAVFLKTGRPVLYSCYPVCGCTDGQHAGKPVAGKTEADVNCGKCKRSMA